MRFSIYELGRSNLPVSFAAPANRMVTVSLFTSHCIKVCLIQHPGSQSLTNVYCAASLLARLNIHHDQPPQHKHVSTFYTNFVAGSSMKDGRKRWISKAV
ncbi:hypothetical protein QQ045_008307 [Rhodiola kirilowii]